MTFISAVLLLFQLITGVVLFIMWFKFGRKPEMDPRLSHGLQLLQSKIAVLEDLSDKSEIQVKQLFQLLEAKTAEVQKKLLEADTMIKKISVSMDKSLEVAKIFEDKIPHREIIERQNTLDYLKAAQLAHEGKTVEEIQQEVNIPQSELEILVRINRNSNFIAEANLPDWASRESLDFAGSGEDSSVVQKSTSNIQKNKFPMSLSDLGEKFREARAEATLPLQTAESLHETEEQGI